MSPEEMSSLKVENLRTDFLEDLNNKYPLTFNQFMKFLSLWMQTNEVDKWYKNMSVKLSNGSNLVTFIEFHNMPLCFQLGLLFEFFLWLKRLYRLNINFRIESDMAYMMVSVNAILMMSFIDNIFRDIERLATNNKEVFTIAIEK